MKNLDEIIKEAAKSRAARRAEQVPATPADTVAKPTPAAPAKETPSPAKQRAKDTAADPTADIGPSAAPAAKPQTGTSQPQGEVPLNTDTKKHYTWKDVVEENKNLAPKQHAPPADFAAVSQMQKAILNFGQVAAGTEAFKMSPQGTGKQTLDSGEYAGGHDPFSSFLFSNYLDKGPEAKAGKGLVTVDNLDTSTRMDTATKRSDVDSIRNWVETIQHVGSPTKGGEGKPDGQWGPRTNNALKAIADFAKMMFTFSDDMGVPVDSAHKQGLEVFTKNIPELEGKGLVQSANAGKLAKTFAGYITNLGTVFQGFKAKIMENPSWKSFLAQDKALVSITQPKLTPHDQATILGSKGQPIKIQMSEEERTTTHQAYQNLTLADLANQNAFVSFLKKNNIEAESPKNITDQLDWLQDRIGKGMPVAAPKFDSVDEVYPAAQQTTIQPQGTR